MAADKSSPPPDPLDSINKVFTNSYAALKSRVIDWAHNSVLLLSGSQFVLFHGEPPNQDGDVVIARETFCFSVPLFHSLKSFCHLPLAVLAIISKQSDFKQASTDLADLLRQTVALSEKLSDEENPYLLSPAQLERNAVLVSETLVLIRELLIKFSQGSLADVDVSHFLNHLRPTFSANMHDATQCCLQAIDETFRSILTRRRQALVGRRLHVVISGEHMPEEDNMALQYFLTAFNQDTEGDGVYYATSKYSEEEIINFVAQHIADGIVGISVFDDGNVMHKDVLAPAAKRILAQWKADGRLPMHEMNSYRRQPKDQARWNCPFVIQRS
ncbi:hypothetical protein HDU85_005421 [Gaertneriomyces sp. JEL0708]|nr:hypothetical protein HDU85_005421 [Gaertneriomyces sp. JEL0708]